jgi:TolB-like protein
VVIISATNEDLGGLVRARAFREDLYHRLAVITLSIPPLREHSADIPLLAEHAIVRACEKYGCPLKQLGADARAAMAAYRWPGNVRELNSVVERAVLLCPATVIPASALQLDVPGELHVGSVAAAPSPSDVRRQRLRNVLGETGWNISRAAAILGVTRNTVRARVVRYGLRPPAPHADGGATVGGRVAAPSIDAPAPRRAARPFPRATARAERGFLTALRGPSIAVLPFHVEGEAESYFGDGIVEDIIGALACLRELLVISRSSTLRYRGMGIDVCDVGRDMGVTYALSGSVRRSAQRLRVSVELAETARGTVVWASHFDGIAADLFALQDQIATKVAGAIAPHVRQTELQRALRKRPDSMEAHDCVLRALAQLYRLGADDFAEAHTWLEKAIALDPAYAMPYALLGEWHMIRIFQGWSEDLPRDHAEVLRLATEALERDSFDAIALALCGQVRSLLLHEFDEAIALFDRALEANPNSAIAWIRSSPTYSYIGDAREAIRRAEQGIRLSPFDPQIFYPHTSLGIGFYVAGEHEEGARWGRKAREDNPRYTANLRFLAANLAAAGHLEEAADASQALLAIEPAFRVETFVERYAIRDPARRDRFAAHLRRAGLPG